MFLNLNINGKGVHKSLNKIYLHADNFCSACDLSIIEKQNAENCCFSGSGNFYVVDCSVIGQVICLGAVYFPLQVSFLLTSRGAHILPFWSQLDWN